MNKILCNTEVGLYKNLILDVIREIHNELNKNECMNDACNFVKDDNLIRTSLYLKNVKLK